MSPDAEAVGPEAGGRHPPSWQRSAGDPPPPPPTPNLISERSSGSAAVQREAASESNYVQREQSPARGPEPRLLIQK